MLVVWCLAGPRAASAAPPAAAKPPAPKAVATKPTAAKPAAAKPIAAKPAVPRWQTLPEPAPLPEPAHSDTFRTDDVTLWYAVFGEGPPVVLLHGGMGSSAQFGSLVPALAEHHQVIVLDSRGHGRSTRSRRGISYRQMADDVVALLDHLRLKQAAVVGWSDGGVTGLELAIRHRPRISRLYVLGTNYDLRGVKPNRSKTFQQYFARCKRQYAQLAPDPGQLGPMLKELRAMWTTQPTLSARDLAKIRAPTVVALGEHDENIRQEHAAELAELIPGATLQRLPDTSHFALWQDPEGFARSVLAWLDAPADETSASGAR